MSRADRVRCLLRVLCSVVACAIDALPARAQQPPPEVFREDFREVAAHMPAVADDLACDFLDFVCIGPGAAQVKLSFHPNVQGDPHYLWNGDCKGPVLLAFRFAHALDCSAKNSEVRINSKNVGGASLHLAMRSGGEWLVQELSVPQHEQWSDDVVSLHLGKWLRLQTSKVQMLPEVATPDWRDISALGFVAPAGGGGSKRCVRLNHFALCSSSAVRPVGVKAARVVRPAPDSTPARAGQAAVADGPMFIEPDAPFVRSALVVDGGQQNRARRAAVVRCGGNVWASFDPDLLRWSAIWSVATPTTQPITLDSMAAVSYPDQKAKAQVAPSIAGNLLHWMAELPGANIGATPIADPRLARLSDGRNPVGPLPSAMARYEGLELCGLVPVIEYRVGDVAVREVMVATQSDHIERVLEIGACSQVLSFRLAASSQVTGLQATQSNASLPSLRVAGDGVELCSSPEHGTWLKVLPGRPRTVQVTFSSGNSPMVAQQVPASNAAMFPSLAPRLASKVAAESKQGPMRVRELALPNCAPQDRAIRPTDIAFLRDGTALVTTLDGDVWRVTDLESPRASWQRIASGLMEPTNIEIDADDNVYVLGRDQVTRLVDRTGDGRIDRYENAADGFWQTLHTRDYAMSMVLEPAGTFLIAKGGIDVSAKTHRENDAHRGAILRVHRDGTCEVLADGLRLPYVGRRDDGAVFASDQQGNWIPSTPVLSIAADQPSFGFVPTRHRGGDEVAMPKLWFPYQSNRSAAGFATLDARAFPGLPDRFLHIAWDGRLFPLLMDPPEGQPFGWRLPLQFLFPSLNGASHPISGAFYAIGLGISGYQPMTQHSAGLASVRQDGDMVVPVALDVQSKSITVVFHEPVPAGVEVSVASLRFWNLRRSSRYGSGHFRWDGTPGEHQLTPESVRWSVDRKRMELQLNGAFRASICALHLQVHRAGESGGYALELFERAAHLPAASASDLASLEVVPVVQRKPGNARLGRELFQRYACSGCHSIAGQKLVGPPLDGIASRHASGIDDYLRQSILDPSQSITKGYEASMPSFEGVIPPQEVDHLIAFLKQLR